MPSGPEKSQDDLARRTQELEAKLAARKPVRKYDDDSNGGGTSGYGQAMKLSSEFISAIAVGVGLGWLIDKVAGTSPWGLVIFLLLGFAAGVLNVLRSAGVVAQPKTGMGPDGSDRSDR